MWLKTVILLLSMSVVSLDASLAQKSTSYENIESYPTSSRFTQFMYRLFYKPIEPPSILADTIGSPRQKPFSAFEGKVIRQIHITTLDPFGHSLGDTTVASLNFLSRTGNQWHINTRTSTVRNQLLIHENQIFDSLLFKESERLVRTGQHLTDVAFYVEETSEDGDSVDVLIRQLDKWSILPGGTFNDRQMSFRLGDVNFLGLGHAFQNEIIRNKASGEYDFSTFYHVPNIHNTYINSTLIYESNREGNYIRSVELHRPFYSPYAKWGAGIAISEIAQNDSVRYENFRPYIYNSQDIWAGKATRLFKSNSPFDRGTKLITALRFNRIRYLKELPEAIDTDLYYRDEDFLVASVGISTRLYVREQYLFNFGLTEYVSTGRIMSLTSGYRLKNGSGMFYHGARYAYGKYYPWGYFSANAELGAFIKDKEATEGVLSVGLDYFTRLVEIGSWKIRQFVKPTLTIGINRYGYDRLVINEEYGLDILNSPILEGNSRLLIMTQTQTYAPWDFIGFHFGPYLNLTLGILGDAKDGIQEGRIYSKIGLGVLIKNDNLAMNTFQLSVAYYPVIPGMENNLLKFNPFQSFDFGLPDFEIGKPGKVNYW
jgi:hypothetical protein